MNFLSGIPQGPGTNCNNTTCPVLTAACCHPDTTCTQVIISECIQSGGYPRSLGSMCQEVDCSDCNENGVPDEVDITGTTSNDVDSNGVPDECQQDCNENGVPDEVDIAGTTSNDVNSNSIPDECEPDCNSNGVPDEVDIAGTTSNDVNTNGVPDECEPDCNGNSVPDAVDIAGTTSNDVNTNGIPDECEPDCNGNGVPDEVDIAGTTSNDINTNGIPDECEPDCNENDVPDSWEIAQGTATDLDTNGIPDLCDILACRYSDLNYNGLPDEIEIAEGSSADANTNGIIDEAEEPAGKHSYLSLLLRASNGPLFVGTDGLPLKVRFNSNGTIALNSNGFVIPDTNGFPLDSWVRDDFLAAKLKEALINTNGPNPVANIKHVKIFFQSCQSGGMLNDIAKAFGNIVCWVGGTAARSNETAKGEVDAAPDPMGRWTRALRDALINTNGTVLQALKVASRTDAASPINRPGSRWVERPVYTTGDKAGGETIPLFDSEATSHHAIFIAGITDQVGIENEITRFCELLESQWGDLDTNGTSVHVLFGTGTKNPCTSSGVPNANILPATVGDLCQLIVDMTTNGTFNPNEELLIFGGDHGFASVPTVNSPPRRSVGRGGPGLVEREFVVSPELKYGMNRDPNNHPFIRILTSGTFAPGSVSVSVNGVVYGDLDPNGMLVYGEPETRTFIPEGSIRVGSNELTIDLNGQPVVVLDAEFFTGAIAPIPMPGWGDINGDTEVDLGDLPDFTDCLAGPGAGYVLPECVYADIDQDGDVDLVDGKLLQSVFTGGIP
ncbi:MAG: hypothetical protein DHS20C16_27650 [Phycisphaerae bacterium]|nr:MAG: hypothetical protein DHS20C16_27650 [Phycisphaerae bacterium]